MTTIVARHTIGSGTGPRTPHSAAGSPPLTADSHKCGHRIAAGTRRHIHACETRASGAPRPARRARRPTAIRMRSRRGDPAARSRGIGHNADPSPVTASFFGTNRSRGLVTGIPRRLHRWLWSAQYAEWVHRRCAEAPGPPCRVCAAFLARASASFQGQIWRFGAADFLSAKIRRCPGRPALADWMTRSREMGKP